MNRVFAAHEALQLRGREDDEHEAWLGQHLARLGEEPMARLEAKRNALNARIIMITTAAAVIIMFPPASQL